MSGRASSPSVPAVAARDDRPPRSGRGNPVTEFGTGVGYLARGLRLWARSPGLLALGVLPALVAAVLLAAALGTLWYFLGDIVDALTGFAGHWSAGARGTFRALVGVALGGASLLVGVLTFTALTLAVGEPFYERISARVEAAAGGAPEAVTVPWWRALGRSVVDGARLILLSALVGVPLFVAGFLPLVGQTVVPVVGALAGGWLLAVELTGVPFERRGLRLRDRRRVLATRRWRTLGFGVATFVLFLVPFGAIIGTPAAVAGATLLARDLHGGGRR